MKNLIDIIARYTVYGLQRNVEIFAGCKIVEISMMRLPISSTLGMREGTSCGSPAVMAN